MPESTRRAFGRVSRILGVAAVVLMLLVVALPLLVNADRFRPALESSLSEALGRQIRVGHLKASLLSGGVAADDLAIADDPAFSPMAFLQAKSLKVVVELMPLIFSRKLNVTGLTIEQPEVFLRQNAAGDWNFSSLGTKSRKPADNGKSLDLSVKLVKITHGRLSMGRAQASARPVVLENVGLELRDFSKESVFPFSFSASASGGGQIGLEGQAGPLNPTDAARTPLQAKLKISSLDLAASGIVEPATGMAGIASFEGQGESNGRNLSVQGQLRAEKLKLVKSGSPARRPVEFDFAVNHDLATRSGTLQRGNLHFGSAPATVTGTYAVRPEGAVWRMVFSGSNMAVPSLAEFLPAMDVVLPAGSSLQGGTASARLLMEGPAARLVTSGSVSLSNTRLAGFNLGGKLAAVEALAGIKGGPNTDIQSFHANLRLAPGGTTVDTLELVAPPIGNLTGSGAISPAHTLDFQMRATLHTSGTLMAALGQRGDTSVPFLIAGTSSDPVFRPDIRSIAREKIGNLANQSGLGKAASGLLNGLFGQKKKN